MSADRWSQIQSVYLQAEALPESQRGAFLDQACAGDRTLRYEVDALLAAHSQTQALTRESAARAGGDDGELPAGTRLGAWSVVRLLGSGGMGEVYEARRADGAFELSCAIKLLKRGMDTAAIVSRFNRERRILARLTHPNIARVLDAGAAPDGRPFLAMEQVDGAPITHYVAEHALGVREIVELMTTVCEAVQAAHAKDIVHRDLKPSNVMVTRDGQVRLLDFGIAKALADGDVSFTQLAGEAVALTPTYAPPEQFLGLKPTPAADVFALGVILYELLVGRLPHRRAGKSQAEIAMTLTRETVVAPSRALRAERGRLAEGERSERLGKVAGDLDRIVLKALHYEPSHRYASAQAFADDLQRFLEHRPVLARPDSMLYRLRRFLRRHALAVSAAAAVIAALLIGLAGALWQAHAARIARADAIARRAQAVELIDFMLGDLKDRLYEVGRLDILDAAVARAERYLQSGDADDPLALAERARVLTDIAEINEWRERLPEAAAAAQGAIDAARKLREREPGERADQQLARALLTWADASAGNADASPQVAEAAALIDPLLAAHGDDPDLLMLKADAGYQAALASLAAAPPQPAEAGHAAQTCLDSLAALGERGGADAQMFQLRCAMTLTTALSRAGENARAATQAQALIADATAAQSRYAQNSTLLASAQGALAYAVTLLVRNDRAAAARDAAPLSLSIAQRLLALDPGNGEWRSKAAIAWLANLRLAMALGDTGAALRASDEALRLHAATLAQDPQNLESRRQAAYVHRYRADLRERAGDRRAAQAEIEQGLALLEAGKPTPRGLLEAQLELQLYAALYAGRPADALAAARATASTFAPPLLQQAMLALLEGHGDEAERIVAELKSGHALDYDLRRLEEFRAAR